ncbi:MAG: DEDD exonuclease domain-containing protein [Jatrophihabitantaceae bacterium]
MATPYVQTSLAELDEPLRTTTFTVVDLETTGGSAATDSITEIGAVRICGGEVQGEFQTLVDPGVPIVAFISVLTGITNSMVADAPRIGSVLPAFLEFARGSVLVAHNAPFDIGFLRAACQRHDLAWPGFAVVDTAIIARRVLTRDEVPNCKLSTLATYFSAVTTPNHRALADARATVDVLHALIGRLGSMGVQTLPELRSFNAQVSSAQRRKRHLADGIPKAPGVYIFRDGQGEPLYVGTSGNLRTRVRQYFLASETRSRMGEMVGLAERVDPIVCAHALEAQVRELRLIAAHKPRYNRRSKFPERSVWLKLTAESFPRLSIVRQVRPDQARYLGPLRSQRQAEAVRQAIHDAVPLRQCSDRLVPGRATRRACLLAGMGRCAAPCEGSADVNTYTMLVELVAAAWSGDPRPLIDPLRIRLTELSVAQRYEQAADTRDQIATIVRACARMQRLNAVSSIEELVAAQPATGESGRPGGWDICVIRRGRLAAAGNVARGVPPGPVIEALIATADVVDTSHTVLAEETEVIANWLQRPGTRLVHASAPWALPARGAGGLLSWLAADHTRALTPDHERRRLPMAARPARATA